ncbi:MULTISPECIES: nuclear transport factor 2 family protein [unclassified Micromonospora]|uniref:nuclear transport factor 2 family protein n=1 Tax=unclassified Micromonospora TaxID=2617518 RepID=UPI0022B62356|nr:MULTISPECIES: nuclear transport factor 2 family protein [unclassified Micromonospora]MCZ7422138.1 nuclear transport factor 2 family protein [Verrucosispora sp. WMMA2121]WBB52478.1 nuclear transport factor 2 family protein [Verrucosispora sp. WMMD573]WBB89875.1 nuclear transport factor 2 family protein [Verrucosispora sp. WMMC514]
MADLKALATAQCDAWNAHDLEGYLSYFSDDAVYTCPGRVIRGKDAIRSYMLTLTEAFPDENLTYKPFVAEGDTVVMRFEARATHSGVFRVSPRRQLAPSGRSYLLDVVSIATFDGDKIVKLEDFFDLYDFAFKQMQFPLPTSAAAR